MNSKYKPITAVYANITRFYQLSSINLTASTLNIYFPPAVTSAYYSIQPMSVTTPITGALVTVKRYDSSTGTYSTISAGTTGVDGIFTLFAQQNVQYQITISHPSYVTLDFAQVFTTNYLIQPQMVPLGTIPDLDVHGGYYVPNVTFTVVPLNPYVRLGTSINFTYQDLASLTSWTSINITWFNYTNLTNMTLQRPYDYRYTTSNDFAINIPLNFTGRYNYTILTYRNGSLSSYTRIYVASNWTGMFDAQVISDTGGPSVLVWKIIFMFVMIFVAAVTFKFIGIGVLFEIPIFTIIGYFWHIWTLPETIIIVGLCIPIMYKLMK